MVLSQLTAANVTEARRVVEIGIVPLVVERATGQTSTSSRQLCRTSQPALDEGSYTMEMSAEFHVRVAACTHNPAVEMLVRSFHGPLLMSLKEAKVAEPPWATAAPRSTWRSWPGRPRPGRDEGHRDHVGPHRPHGHPGLRPGPDSLTRTSFGWA